MPDLDRSIRNAVLTAYRTGQHTLDVTDLVATVVDGMIASDPTVTRRGCFGLLNRLNRVARP